MWDSVQKKSRKKPQTNPSRGWGGGSVGEVHTTYVGGLEFSYPVPTDKWGVPVWNPESLLLGDERQADPWGSLAGLVETMRFLEQASTPHIHMHYAHACMTQNLKNQNSNLKCMPSWLPGVPCNRSCLEGQGERVIWLGVWCLWEQKGKMPCQLQLSGPVPAVILSSAPGSVAVTCEYDWAHNSAARTLPL